jgi:hypothetical protein
MLDGCKVFSFRAEQIVVEVYINCKLMETKLPDEYENKHHKHAGLPIDKMLYIYLLCPHSQDQENLFQSKQT